MTEETTPKLSKPSKGDKLDIIKILILAIISFLAGFACVYFVFGQSAKNIESEDQQPETENVLASDQNDNNIKSDKTDLSENGGSENNGSENSGSENSGSFNNDNSNAAINEGNAPPEVPPGKTPDGIVLDGAGYYLKCWDDDGVEHKGNDCDKLGILEKRFATRLYVIAKCKNETVGENTEGKLSVASEVDFSKQKINFWSGASSDIAKASQIGSCLRTSLSGLPIHKIDHKFARYRIFYTVLFGKAAAKKEKKANSLTFASKKGKLVNVSKDRVRLRKSPVDGDIVGKISTGNQVRLIKKKNGWCNVITPNNNEGWMICDALEL